MKIKAKLKKVVKKYDDCVILNILPENNKLNFKAGQYITLITNIENKEERRAYSIYNNNEDDTYNILIKCIDKGIFSNYAYNNFNENSEIEIHKPEGNFVYDAEENSHNLYIAAGSGITPIYSMINYALNNQSNSKHTLVFSNQTLNKTIFFEELNILKQKYPKRFNVLFFLTQEENSNYYFGRISSKIINNLMITDQIEKTFDNHYICGPESMKNDIIDWLTKGKVESSNIKFEIFHSKIDETTIENKIGIANSSIITIIDDLEYKFEYSDKYESILDSAIDNDIDLPFSCKGGVCSTCKCEVIEGEYNMYLNNSLTDYEINNNYILSCKTVPLSEKLVLNFDV